MTTLARSTGYDSDGWPTEAVSRLLDSGVVVRVETTTRPWEEEERMTARYGSALSALEAYRHDGGLWTVVERGGAVRFTHLLRDEARDVIVSEVLGENRP